MVRDLYKRFLVAGRNYPEGLFSLRQQVKRKFFENHHLDENSIEFKHCIKYGRYMVNEIQALGRLHKYRTLKRRYDP